MAGAKGEPLNVWLVRHVTEGADLERRLAEQAVADAHLLERAAAMQKERRL